MMDSIGIMRVKRRKNEKTFAAIKINSQIDATTVTVIFYFLSTQKKYLSDEILGRSPKYYCSPHFVPSMYKFISDFEYFAATHIMDMSVPDEGRGAIAAIEEIKNDGEDAYIILSNNKNKMLKGKPMRYEEFRSKYEVEKEFSYDE